jgi:uncharacterized protein YdhG (YjbR/CyaY superfamily)
MGCGGRSKQRPYETGAAKNYDGPDFARDICQGELALRAAAPGAVERTDYFRMPGYSYPGIDYYDGMFTWFSFKKPHVRLHVPPSVIQKYKKELASYATTKAIISFPMGKPAPMTLVKKLVKASVKAMKDKAEETSPS